MTLTVPPRRTATSWLSGARRLAALAATPLVPADYVDLIAPLASRSDLRARVLAVEPETADAATIWLRPGRGWRGHVPGQYVRLGVDVDGVRHWRAYSVTAADGDRIAVTVKAIPDGVVSNHLVRRTEPGTVVQLDQATGDFVLPAVPGPLLFVTGGSGITPVMGMLRSGAPDDVVLIHSAQTRDDVVFGAELRALAAAGAIRLVEIHNDTDGLLDVRTLPTLVPDLADREVFTCGPTGLMDAVEEELAGLGLLERLHAERFRPSILAIGEGGTATFGTTAVEAPGDRPLLDVGEEAGVLMPSGCRMGICFGCVLPLREGAVRDLRSGDLTTAGPGVLVQTCVSAAAGACDLDV
ncbi:MAG TPA: ferredoxin reductase [Mycobacteriales bacterium]|nr:ferredoxin reductase [Mycobacteriales bacterium]